MIKKIYLATLYCELCDLNGTWSGLEKPFFYECPKCKRKLTLNYYEDKIEEEQERKLREEIQKTIDDIYKKELK